MELDNVVFRELNELRRVYPDVNLSMNDGFVKIAIVVTSCKEREFEIRCIYPLELCKKDYARYEVLPFPFRKKTEYLGGRFHWGEESYYLHTLKEVADKFCELINLQEKAMSLKTEMKIDEELFNFFYINQDWLDNKE